MDTILQRLAWWEKLSAERHAENVERLMRIETEVKTTNGRVTRNEEQIRTLQTRPSAIAQAKMFAAFAGWILAGFIALLKLLGKL